MQDAGDRWSTYTDVVPEVAAGWRLETVTPPSRLGGANGMTLGPDGRLHVTQVFGSQVTAIDVDSGEHAVFSPLGGGITGPDDGFFGADGTFYATEPMSGRVTARDPDGSYRVLRDDLPAANGVTMDHARRRLFIDEFREGGRLLEVDPTGRDEPRVLLEDLAGPNAPAMGPDGLLYFPQVFADQVWCYDLDAGTARLAVDELSRPTAVKFDSRGRIVVSEAGAGRIVAVDLATGTREVLADVPLGIDNVSVGAGDRIFVSHFVDGRVAEETAGRRRVLSPPGLLGPHGLTVDAAGNVLFADGLSVGAVVDGVAERTIRLLVDLPTLALGVARFAEAVAVLGAGGVVLRYGDDGGAWTVLADGLVDATCLRVDGERLLVAERHAGRVSAVDARRQGGAGARRARVGGRRRPSARRVRRHDGADGAPDRRRRQRTPRRGLRRRPGRVGGGRCGAGGGRGTPRAGRRGRGVRPSRGRGRRRTRRPPGSRGGARRRSARWPPTVPVASSSGATVTARSADSPGSDRPGPPRT